MKKKHAHHTKTFPIVQDISLLTNARVRSFSNSAFKKGVEVVIDETEWFIEWTAAEIEPEQAEELVNIQVQLARWQINLDNILLDELRRGEVADIQAETYSQKVLDMSGLLDSVV